MVNKYEAFAPIFRNPTPKGLRVGLISLAIYIVILVAIDRLIIKIDGIKKKDFFFLNFTAFIITLTLFIIVGGMFFMPDNIDCA